MSLPQADENKTKSVADFQQTQLRCRRRILYLSTSSGARHLLRKLHFPPCQIWQALASLTPPAPQSSCRGAKISAKLESITASGIQQKLMRLDLIIAAKSRTLLWSVWSLPASRKATRILIQDATITGSYFNRIITWKHAEVWPKRSNA